MTESKNILEKAVDATKDAADATRSKVHEMTKDPEKDRNMQEKVEDSIPKNAEDAGTKLGKFVDDGMKKAKDTVHEMNEKRKEQAEQ